MYLTGYYAVGYYDTAYYRLGAVAAAAPDADVGRPLDYGGNAGVAWSGRRRIRRKKQQAAILAAIKAFIETVDP